MRLAVSQVMNNLSCCPTPRTGTPIELLIRAIGHGATHQLWASRKALDQIHPFVATRWMIHAI